LIASPISAQDSDFSGTWETNWGPVVFTQIGNKVEGDYTGKYDGYISGTVKGDRLDFEWKQPDGQWGKGYFILKGDKIHGRWGHGRSNSSGGPWEGKRK